MWLFLYPYKVGLFFSMHGYFNTQCDAWKKNLMMSKGYAVRNSPHFWWECYLVRHPWETTWRLLKNLRVPFHLTYQLFSWHVKHKNINSKNINVHLSPMFIAALICTINIIKSHSCNKNDRQFMHHK